MMSKTLVLFVTIALACGKETQCKSTCSEECEQFCDTELHTACCMMEFEEFLSNNLLLDDPMTDSNSGNVQLGGHDIDVIHKRNAAFNDVLRLGKRIPTSDVLRLGKRDEFLRLGRTPLNDVLRLGKRSEPEVRSPSIDSILRLGKRSSNLDNFLRLGKRIPETMKRNDDMLRLGKRPALVDDVARFDTRYGNDDMLRLGKRSITLGVPAWLGKRTRLSISPAFNDVLRLGKRTSNDMLRLGKRDG